MSTPSVPINTIQRLKNPMQVPLTIAQQGLWFVSQADDGASAAYNVTLAFRTTHPVDPDVLQRAWSAVCTRHPLLGGRIEVVDYVPRFSGLDQPAAAQVGLLDGELQEAARAHGAEPFDFARGPLNRIALVNSPDGQGLVITMPHLIVDGQSAEVLLDDLQNCYSAAEVGTPVHWRTEPMNQQAVVAREAAALNSRNDRDPVADIMRRLEGAGEIPSLAIPVEGGERAGARAGHASVQLATDVAERIRAAARRLDATPAALCLAATALLAWRYFQCEDVPFSAPISHRGNDATTVNYLSNLHIGRLRVEPRMSGEALVQAAMDELCDMIDAAEIPLPTVVRALKRHGRATALAAQPALGFNFQQVDRVVRRLGEAELVPVDIAPERAKDALLVDILVTPSGMRCALQFDLRLVSQELGAAMIAAYVQLLDGLCTDAGRGVREIDATRGSYDGSKPPSASNDADVLMLFRAQVAARPDATAIECNGSSLDYRQLDTDSDALAARLVEVGVGPEQAVAVYLPRGIDAAVAALAVLKSGGVYVPVDPTLPKARREALVADVHAVVAIEASNKMPPGIAVVRLGAAAREVGAIAAQMPLPPSRLAYVIHTSGSTGRQKPVGVSVEALGAHVHACVSRYGLSPVDRVLQFASTALDPSLEQLFASLCAGAAVVMRGEETWSPEQLLEFLHMNALTVADIPTVYWEALARTGFDGLARLPLRLLLIGGEAARSVPPPDLPFAWMNAYGPTEACITATLLSSTELPANAMAPLPIGRPLPGVRALVLDESLYPVPDGAVGELCLGGGRLARGYLGQPATTAAAFVPDPTDHAGGRLYRTGDMVRRQANGVLQFVGRIDRQVKIRGFRVEPAEVEAALRRVDGIADAAVKGVPKDDGWRLVAYVVAPSQTTGTLRQALMLALPEPMIPTAWVFLDQLPVAPSGKIDYAALLPPGDAGSTLVTASSEPRSELESALVRIWAETLKLPTVGIHDNFFELGGHSLLATQLVARMGQALGKRVTLRALFDAPSVAQLAERFEAAPAAEEAAAF